MSVVDQMALLERDVELATLDEVIGMCARGGGRLVVIEGSPGIGKSRLLSEACERARAAGIGVLSARASELEREFGFGVVRQLFEPHLVAMSEAERADVLAGAAAPAAAVVAPTVPAPEAGVDASFATLHGLYWLSANLAVARPLMLAIDDLHWCDLPSLRWLAYLLRRLEGLALLIAVALRPAEPGPDAALLAHVLDDPVGTVLRPGRLSEAAAGRLVRSALSERADPAFCAACHAESGGNPLLLRQLLGAVAAERLVPTASEVRRLRELGANAVTRVVALRFARLPAAAVSLAGAVAILGDGAELRHAAAVAGIDDDAAHAAAASLSRIDILQPDLPLSFVHPMVRAAVAARLAPAERAAGHARAARLLAADGAAAAAVSSHLLHAPPEGDGMVVATLREAAHQALPRGGADSAVAYLRRALAEPPRPEERLDVLLELAAAEALVDGPAALAHLEQAHELADAPVARARIAIALAEGLFFMARPEAAVAVLTRALEPLGAADRGLRRELEVARLHVALTEPSLYPQALELLRRLEPEPPTDDLTGKFLLAERAYHAANTCAPREQALALARQAVAGGLLVERANGGAAFASVILALLATDETEAARLLDASLADAHRRGSVLGYAAAKVFGSRLALLQGALREAEAAAREGLEACEAWGIAFGPAYARAYLADALMEAGDTQRAAETLEAAIEGRDWPPFKPQTSWLLEARARLLLAQGDLREGASRMIELGRGFAALGGRNPAFHPWRSDTALALLALGERRRASELAAEELELARSWGAPRALGRALRAAGLVEGGDVGLALLGEAVDLLEHSPARLEHAKALVELGAALRRARRRTDARDPLRRGLEQATICGAAPLAERAEAELLASGARPRRIALTGVDSLTPSERRVADLAATGATNREIAQELFVTIKTVEMHLANAYGKLGIRARAQLADALGAGRTSPGRAEHRAVVGPP